MKIVSSVAKLLCLSLTHIALAAPSAMEITSQMEKQMTHFTKRALWESPDTVEPSADQPFVVTSSMRHDPPNLMEILRGNTIIAAHKFRKDTQEIGIYYDWPAIRQLQSKDKKDGEIYFKKGSGLNLGLIERDDIPASFVGVYIEKKDSTKAIYFYDYTVTPREFLERIINEF